MRLESNDRRAGSRLVALLGESLLMDSVEAILNRVREHPHSLDVVRLPVMSADQGPPPRLMPDLIISDLSAVQLCDVSHYLDYFPYIPFLGIDPTSHRVLALSCQPFNVRSVEDLTTVIDIITETETQPAATGGASAD